MSPRRRQEDEGEELEQEEELTTRGRHPSKRTKLFSDSGLSDLERREIRQNQRALQQTLRDGEHSTIDELSEARKTNNAIFNDKVRYTREGA